MAWWLPTACVVATVLGCGSEQSAPPGTTSVGSALYAVSPHSAAQSPLAGTSGAVAPQCQTSDLAAGLGPETAAAGTVAFPIVFTNNGSGPCVLEGFPGVSYATGPDSAPVGAPAARDGASSGPVQLSPGGQGSALVYALNVSNIAPEQCQPVSVSGLRIYPPDNTVSLYLERAGTACSLAQATTSQLRIHAVVAGTSDR
ncbi:DUF4232 domain-containing protein [Nocardia sp. KC 131]|uniref:DUF4232 domain-containing protein n=1 Tax=Nocardia arseniciresistens TaxID=3392119 RepID=UPI00398F66E2